MELPATDDVAQLLAHLTGPLKIKAANAQAYAVALAAQDIDAELFDDLALDELESTYSFSKGDLMRVERHRNGGATPDPPATPRGAASPMLRASSSPRAWAAAIGDGGDDARRAALQDVVEAWRPGRWQLSAVLGRGGSGVVFASSDTRLGRVAIKFVHNEMPEKLEREAALMQRCAHENVCKLFESQVDEDGVCGLVLELLDKGSLEQAMDAAPDKRIREFEVTRLSLHILAALVFMHSQGVIHRDIKPANICLTEVDGQRLYKLIDLSIAAMELGNRDGVSKTLVTGTTGLAALIGTPHYMSPEQFSEGVVVTTQTDLWSLGVVMFEALGGAKPFGRRDTDRNVISYAIVNTSAPALDDEIEEVGVVSEPMSSVVSRALKKDLGQRFQTAADMRQALEDAIKFQGDETFSLFISYR